MPSDSSPQPQVQVHHNDGIGGGAGGLSFQSMRDSFRFRRSCKQNLNNSNASSDRPASASRSRTNNNRSDRHGRFMFRRKTAYAVFTFTIFILCTVSLFLQIQLASVFFQWSEKAWSHEADMNIRMALKFMPWSDLHSRRIIDGNELDRVRSEDRSHIGVRKPRLALILGNMEKDPRSLMLISIIKNIKELGYVIEMFAVEKGKMRQSWNQLGKLFLLRPELYGHIDWSLFEGIIADSLEAKEAIASTMSEPFCSIPLIWIVQDDTLAKHIKMNKEMSWKNIISHWRSTLSRASVIVFPNFALPMLYSELDTGNFRVVYGSPVDVWVAESYRKSHSKYQLRKDYGFGTEDIVVLIVGSSLFYNELSLEDDVALHSIEALLTKYAKMKSTGGSFKFVFLCGNSTERYNDALQEITSRLGLLNGSLSHYGFDNNVNDILLMADIVLYGSLQNIQDFPSLLIRAMTFGIPVVAPDLPTIKQYVVEGSRRRGILITKFKSDALIRAFSILISDRKISRFGHHVASSGRLLAKNMFANECITGYANLLEEVLNFPSDVMMPGSVAQFPISGKWEWHLFRKEIEAHSVDDDVKSKPSVVIKREKLFSNINPVYFSNPTSTGKQIRVHDIPTQQDWDIIEEIERSEEYDRVEMEELRERTDRKLGVWEELYRKARKCDRINLENERNEGELERTGQPVSIYEIYSGSAAWPFLHHGCLYRGLSLSTRALRLRSDDVNAVERLHLLRNRYYLDILCDIGGMFAIAKKIDKIHRKPWIGFQPWQAAGRKVSLTAKAEKALEEAIEKNIRGEVIYFWASLNMDHTFVNTSLASPFWTMCDILNRGNCRTTFEAAFKQMYGIPSYTEALPSMPDDGGRWSALHSWVMPTPLFLEFIMFSRMFVDSLDVVHRNSTKAKGCSLAYSKLEERHCYCRMLEVVVNVWAYHSGRKMVYLDPYTGLMKEEHQVEERQEFMWSKFFNATLLKEMDEDLAEAADDDDYPYEKWLWPLTGDVFWKGIYEKQKEEKYRLKMDKIRKTREKKLNRHKHRYKQKPLSVSVSG